MLAEIAFWQPINELNLVSEEKRLDPKAFVGDLKAKCKRTLPHMVGQSFADAVSACSEFAQDTRAMSASDMQRHFQSAIRDNLKIAARV